MITAILLMLLFGILLTSKSPEYFPIGKDRIIKEGGVADIIERNSQIYVCGSFGVVPYDKDSE